MSSCDPNLTTLEAKVMRVRCLIPLLLVVASPSVSALDAACEPVVKASEARINQPAWHSIMEFGKGERMEAIKVSGQFFHQIDGKWAKFPVNLDVAEGKILAQIRSGEVKLTDCKVVGNDIVEGVPVTLVSSRTEMTGVPPSGATLYIGKQDGLPYRQVGDGVTVVYRYKDVVVPKL
jgi:hypothetical protein